MENLFIDPTLILIIAAFAGFFMAFGIAFEIPVAIILLVWTGAVEPESLRQKRPYIIVFAFVVGMLLTPPDIISQTLLAIPMCILFEVGLFFYKL